MIDITTLKDEIKNTIYPNGKGAINASDHQQLLLNMADAISEIKGGLDLVNESLDDLQSEIGDRVTESQLSAAIAEAITTTLNTEV